MFRSAASSPCASSSSPAIEAFTLVHPPSTNRPTLQQLAALTALPVGMGAVRLVNGRGRGRGKKSKSSTVTKTYNPVGPRPYPTLTSLMQQIRVTDEFEQGIVTTSVTVPTYGSLVFQLSTFANIAPYLAVFDQYCIAEIEVWCESTAPQGTTAFTEMMTAVDLDDANTPTSLAEVMCKQGAVVASQGTGRYHKWQPHVAIAAFSGTFTSYSNQPASWIDSASPNVQHYGFKLACDAGPVQVIAVKARATILFRAPGL